MNERHGVEKADVLCYRCDDISRAGELQQMSAIANNDSDDFRPW